MIAKSAAHVILCRRAQVAALLLFLVALPALPQAGNSAFYRIAGTIVNANSGEPLRRASIAILNEADSHTVQSVESDSNGHFAFEGLPAAKFQLTASKRGFLTSFYEQHGEFNSAIVTAPTQETGELTFRLTPCSIVRGVVTSDGGEPVEKAEVMLFAKPSGHKLGERITEVGSTTTNDAGAYEFGNLPAGSYFVAVKAEPWYAIHRSSGATSSGSLNAALDVAYPVTYFDSTTDEASASPILLADGRTAEANLILHALPALHLTLDAPRAADGLSVTAMPTLHQSVFGAKIFTESLTVPANSRQRTVEFSGLAPGQYELAQGNPPRISELNASVSQQVDTSTGTPAVNVSGSLQSLSGAALAGDLTVTIEALHSDQQQMTLEAELKQGSFTFPAVMPGSWRLQVESSGSPLAVASITTAGRTHNGNKITVDDHPLTLVVLVSQGATRIEGFAQKNNKGYSGAMIVLVPQNLKSLRGRVRRDQSDSDGSFSLRDVLPGQYVVVAIEDGWELDWANPEIIARYLSHGIPVSITSDMVSQMPLAEAVPVQSR